MRHTRKVLISPTTLAQMLDLPPRAVIQHIGTQIDPNTIVVIVSHPDYEPVMEDTESPIAMADIEVLRVPGPDYDANHPDAIVNRPLMRWRLWP